MYELLIDKVIGEDEWRAWIGEETEISSADVRAALSAFPSGETEMRIVIDSPGGDVFEGITMFNIIRDFARNHPDVRITTYIQGMAASMASVVALAAWSVNPANTVVAEDNAVFMIHNAWGIVIGNANDMRDGADWFGKIDDMLRASYVRRTGKSEEDIRAMMDAETWLWGNEIKDAGFADEILDSAQAEGVQDNIASGKVFSVANDKANRLVSAKAAFKKSQELLQSVSAKRRETNGGRNFRAAAMALGLTGGSPSKTGAAASAEDKKGGCMKITADELKRDNPDVYAQVVQDGEKSGVAKEQARASRLLALGEKSGAMDYALECIKNGSDPADEKVIDSFMDRGAAAKALALQKEDGDVPDVNPPKNDKNADLNAVMAAFDRETGADKWEK